MSGRFVLLEFDELDAAQGWTKSLTEGLAQDPRGARVRGIYYRPTVFCKCPDKTKQSAGNWVRAKRFGIFICKTCRRPSIFHQRGINRRLEWALGHNLLEE